jgi:hypothetical protein
LSYFDQINELVQTSLAKAGIEMRLFVNGNLLNRFSLEEIKFPNLEGLAGNLAWLKMCRFVAGRLGLNLVLPASKKITKEQRRMMIFAHELLQGKEVRQKIPFGKFSGAVSVPANQIQITGEVGSQRIVMAAIPLDCLGTQIRLGPVGNEFTNVRITSVSPAGADSSNLVKCGTKNTERIMVLLKPTSPLAQA